MALIWPARPSGRLSSVRKRCQLLSKIVSWRSPTAWTPRRAAEVLTGALPVWVRAHVDADLGRGVDFGCDVATRVVGIGELVKLDVGWLREAEDESRA